MSTRPTERTQIGPYHISEQIGEGGMGVVYLASAPEGALVAVKTLRPWLVGGVDGRRRFEREVATLRRVRGPRVAEVLDADVNADAPYIVTRYVQGVPLTRLVAENGPLERQDLEPLARGLLEALASVHAAGVVHRDVKPANVLLAGDGPVLIDFGIAHAADDTRLTATGFISGTPGYFAPETVMGHDPTPATDLHGWAATLVFAATGRPPYGNGPDIAVLDRIRRGEHDLRGVDARLAPLLAAALRVDPGRRPSIAEALRALDQPDTAETMIHPAAALARPDAAETQAMPPVPPLPQATPPAMPPVAPSPSRPPVPQPPPQQAADERPRAWRSWLVIGLGAMLLALTISWAPYAGTASALGVLLVGRVTWRIKRRLFERRKTRGPHKNDGVMAALAVPWDLLASVVPCVGQVMVAMAGALAAGNLLDLVDQGGQRTPYFVAATVATLLVWWGPGTIRSRHGLRVLTTPLDRAPRAAWVAIGVLAVAVCAAVLLWESYGTIWWPAAEAPHPPLPWFTW